MTARWLIDLHGLKDRLRGCNISLDIEQQLLRLPHRFLGLYGYDLGLRPSGSGVAWCALKKEAPDA